MGDYDRLNRGQLIELLEHYERQCVHLRSVNYGLELSVKKLLKMPITFKREDGVLVSMHYRLQSEQDIDDEWRMSDSANLRGGG